MQLVIRCESAGKVVVAVVVRKFHLLGELIHQSLHVIALHVAELASGKKKKRGQEMPHFFIIVHESAVGKLSLENSFKLLPIHGYITLPPLFGRLGLVSFASSSA
jgi:hypothetical protein